MVGWPVLGLTSIIVVVQGYQGYQHHQGGYQDHQDHQGYQGYQSHQSYQGFQEHPGYQRDSYQYERRLVAMPKSISKYVPPTAYPCMEDWNKVCQNNTDCCSGVCMTTFCKVQGIEVTSRPKKKRPRVIINISK